ncbi:MAG: UDP-glucose 4-epimerase GalE [Deltaproteobacteria bacterium]|nr:UDP-glucose 4-epimerase GalE [Deltaproteobacteria bacterium]
MQDQAFAGLKGRSVLVVGGAGYIGSHVSKQLAARGYDAVILDDLSTGHREAARFGTFIEGDCGDPAVMDRVFREHGIGVVMHFAARAMVGESMENPILYYETNVAKTLLLLAAMLRADVKHFVFSSTCATFGETDKPIREDMPQAPVNPYGRGKLMVETALRDLQSAHGMNSAVLRYFNAAGTDPEGELGEDHAPETHLIARALAAAFGHGANLTVFGKDYPTPDGSGMRDYVHVNDLGDAHIQAMEKILTGGGFQDFNLGTGHGSSVFEVLAAVKRATGREVPHAVGPRRAGDPPRLVADSARARSVLGWKPRFDLDAIVKTAAAWHGKHPNGYGDKKK